MKDNKKANQVDSTNRYQAFLLVAFLFAAFSCTTIDPKYDKSVSTSPVKTKRISFEDNLNNLIGKLTYDQALMTWGEPSSTFEGDEIFLATWGNQTSGNAIFPINKTWFSMPIESGWRLQLSFDKKTRLLKGWIYKKW